MTEKDKECVLRGTLDQLDKAMTSLVDTIPLLTVENLKEFQERGGRAPPPPKVDCCRKTKPDPRLKNLHPGASKFQKSYYKLMCVYDPRNKPKKPKPKPHVSELDRGNPRETICAGNNYFFQDNKCCVRPNKEDTREVFGIEQLTGMYPILARITGGGRRAARNIDPEDLMGYVHDSNYGFPFTLDTAIKLLEEWTRLDRKEQVTVEECLFGIHQSKKYFKLVKTGDRNLIEDAIMKWGTTDKQKRKMAKKSN